MIAAILRAQWRSQRAFGLGVKRATTWFALLIGLVYYGFWAALAFGAGAFFARVADAALLNLTLPSVLMGIVLYWQIAPVVTASMGSSLDLKKLLAYPVPHQKLFVVELLLRITTVGEMLLVSIAVAVGVALNPLSGRLGAVRAVAALILLIAINVFFGSGMRSLIERLLRNRRARLALFLLFIITAVTPQILLASHFDFARLGAYAPVAVFYPWGALAHLMLGATPARAAGLSIIFTLLAFRFGRWQFFHGLRYAGDETPARASAASEATSRRLDVLFRLPGRLLQDPLGAIVEKEVRSLSRNPRFRTVFIMGFSFGLLIWLPNIMGGADQHKPAFMRTHFLTIVTLYALVMLGQVSYWNCFAFDRTAVQFYFSVPVAFRRVLVGKNLAVAFFTCAEIVMVLLMASLFRVQMDGFRIAEAICVTLVASIYLFSLGNLTSVRVPRPLNAEKMTQGGAARSLNAAMFLLAPFALLPIGLAYWARHIFESELIFFALLLVALGLGAILYWVALDSAAQTASRTREKIITELSRGEGPLSVE
jgi:ABC-2 type transport system permease protein